LKKIKEFGEMAAFNIKNEIAMWEIPQMHECFIYILQKENTVRRYKRFLTEVVLGW
jgi:hypothetical protein